MGPWNLHFIAVWNTIAWLQINKHNPTSCHDGCKILLVTYLKQIGTPTKLLASQYVMLGTLRQRLVFRNLRKFAQTECKLPGAPTDLLWVKWPPLPSGSKPGLTLKIPDWVSWTYTDGSCHIQECKTVIGAGVYHPSSGNSNLVEPTGFEMVLV